MRLRSSSALLLLASAIVASACSVNVENAEPAPAEPAPTALGNAKIPADFTFASTRSAGIHVSVNLDNLPADKEFPIEIWNMRHELLAAAKPDAKGKLTLDYPLPLGDTQLLIKVGDQEQIVSLDKNNAASATFE